MGRTIALLVLVTLSGCGSCSGDEQRPAPSTAPPTTTTPPPTTSAAPTTIVPTPPASEARPTLPTPPVSDALRRRALLAEGRRLEHGGDHAEAIARYERALAIAPGDATLLTELGWAQFHAGELDEAFASTEDALDRSETPREQAIALYNLGRIAEAAEHTGAALELYRRSLALRSNDTVRARIVALGGTPPAEGEVPVEAWTRAFLADAGPFPDLRAVCLQLLGGEGVVEGEEEGEGEGEEAVGPRCDPTLAHGVTGTRGVLEAGTISVVGRDMIDDSVTSLVARTAAGWFVVTELGSDYYGPSSLNGGELHIVTLELRDVVPGGDLELFVARDDATIWASWCEGGSEETSETLVCGVVGSGFGCWLAAVTHHAVTSGTWRDGEGWTAGMTPEESASTCAGEGVDGAPEYTELGAAIEDVVGEPSDESTIVIGFDATGRVSFDGDHRPRALASPVDLFRLPCLGPQPDPAFACP